MASFKSIIIGSTALSFCAFSGLAHAQDTTPAPAAGQTADQGSGGDIVVTGTRIVRNGYEAPTPTTIVTTDELTKTSPISITQGLNKLPQFADSQTQAGSSGGLGSGGVNNIGSFLNLRNFGTLRTLILLDGKRVPPTNFDGNVDVDTLPQALVQRVDVVTGGVSAVYGSDAVTGVVNYVLDRKFTGIKGLAQAGVSTYGDGGSQRLSLSAGVPFAEGRGHILLSGEYRNEDGVPRKEERPWFKQQLLTGNGSAAAPYLTVDYGRENDRSFSGLIRRTGTINPNIPDSLANMQFNADGTLRPFDKGAPTNSANLSSGGDGTYHPDTSLLASLRTKQAFGRVQYDFSDAFSAFAQVSYSDLTSHHTQATANRADTSTSKPIIFADNAFLSPEVRSIMTANNIDSLTVSLRGLYIGRPDFEIDTKNLIGTLGFEGKVGSRFHWDLSYTYGKGQTDQIQHDNGSNPKFYAALDAVRDPASGDVVCRVSLTQYADLYPGCVPINIFGDHRGEAQQDAAIAYINEDTAWYSTNRTDDVVANFGGDLFDLWAGPVSFNLNGEYRHQKFSLRSSVEATAPVDFTGLTHDGWVDSTLAYTGVLVSSGGGSQEVYEIGGELVVPLLKDSSLGKSLDLSGAARYTHYRTSGGVTTWKAGLTYAPIDDLSFRAVVSRDIRAPSLYELFQPNSIRNLGSPADPYGPAVTYQQIAGGNPNLVPEVAHTYTLGAVITPTFMPGFSASIDYYHIRINNIIGEVPTDVQLHDCPPGTHASPFCANITRNPDGTLKSVFTGPTNGAFAETQGVDADLSYRSRVSALGPDGAVGLRLFAAYQPHFRQRNYPGDRTLDYAGVGRDYFAKWRITTELDVKAAGFDITILNRFKSGAKRSGDPELIYLDPNLGSYDVTDLTIGRDIEMGHATARFFINVSNLFNRWPRILANGSPGQVTPVVNGDDVMGRYFTTGFRFKF
jgi:outer membrane receptor protein involved in Fe transport